ncbi:MAG: DUF1571 domain-containing protein [Planctomycetaceae bacterium]|jgi:hypothetical protein|nr:DUF1571 domain-containing protein [Planctomycetaceae bacterium]
MNKTMIFLILRNNILAALFVVGVVVSILIPQASGQQTAESGLKVAASQVTNTAVQVVNEHPLVPVIRWAEKERPRVLAIQDYTALMTKQENIGGVVQEAQVMEIKVRHNPLSFYLKFRYPRKMNGQEAIYIRNQNGDKVIGHGVGLERNFGTQFLDPEGIIAMRGCKYSIKEMGILNLVDKLLDVGRKDSKYGECDVQYFEGVKVDDRDCTLIQVTHPVPRKNFIFYIARIYVDKELNLPIRYESFDWPKKEGETPTLIEAYTYQKMKINVGLTDADFDYRNPEYNYP